MTSKLTSLLEKKSKSLKTLQCTIISKQHNIDIRVSSTTIDQAFHSASVGKLFTSVLTMMAIEEGRILLSSKISSLLPSSCLEYLFLYESIDYKDQVTIEHLLSHTSGVNDYFESKTIDGSSFIQEVLTQPEKFYTPHDLILFTQQNQRAVGKPGTKFHYSDTGFVLLGLILESIYGEGLNTLFQNKIVQPSRLENTFLCFYDDRFDSRKLAPLWMNGVEASQFKSLSCDFSGGGLHTSAEDLTKFLHALVEGKLISQHSLNLMMNFNHKFRTGMHYGLGMMQLRPVEFFFLFKSLPNMIGHLGVTGVHAWIDVETKTSIVLNVGNNKGLPKSFQLVITIMQMIKSLDKKR
jgi:D-alanyl-D-alanine carboxypeptidase